MANFGGFTPPPPPGPPPRIPPGHRAVWSNQHGAFYYVSTRTGATVWAPIMVDEPQTRDRDQLDLDMSDEDDTPFIDAATSLRQESPVFQDGRAQASGGSHYGGSPRGNAETSYSDLTKKPLGGATVPESGEKLGIDEDAFQSGLTARDDIEMPDSNAGMGAESTWQTGEVLANSPPVAGSSRAPINIDIDDIQEAAITQSRGKRQESPGKQSIHVAEVGETAARVAASTADLDNSMLLTIQKMLSRADQGGANETEAKTALRLATKLMHRFNVTRAEVLAHNPEGQQKYTGQSLVNIRRRDLNPNKLVMMYVYVDTLSVAISTYFGTRSYSRSSRRGSNEPLVITFYGIAENTVAAAHAFAMSYNLAVRWGLQDSANVEKDEEEEAAIQAEKDEDTRRILQEAADEQARLNRLNPPDTCDLSDDEEVDVAVFSSGGKQAEVDGGIEFLDGEDETGGDESAPYCDDDNGGFDTARLLLSTLCSPEPIPRPPLPSTSSKFSSTSIPSNPTTRIDGAPEPSWSSRTQLIAYRNTREKMAEDYLKDRNIKLKKARAKKINDLDKAAYKQGKKDAKKINVRRRAIQEG